jgi:hypothetical protein
VLVRVEVKDQSNPVDVTAAKAIYKGLTIEGESPKDLPRVDLLSGYSEAVVEEANNRMDEVFAQRPIADLILRHDQELGVDVSYLEHGAVTRGGWGAPDPGHSAYETLFFDDKGEPLEGSKGTYTATTGNPPVDAFWSVTAYDTDRGGFLHPNDSDRYHINNTTAIKNDDNTITFLFKTDCAAADRNCLEVPAGRFDLVVRYYLPHQVIIAGNWTFPEIELEGG